MLSPESKKALNATYVVATDDLETLDIDYAKKKKKSEDEDKKQEELAKIEKETEAILSMLDSEKKIPKKNVELFVESFLLESDLEHYISWATEGATSLSWEAEIKVCLLLLLFAFLIMFRFRLLSRLRTLLSTWGAIMLSTARYQPTS